MIISIRSIRSVIVRYLDECVMTTSDARIASASGVSGHLYQHIRQICIFIVQSQDSVDDDFICDLEFVSISIA